MQAYVKRLRIENNLTQKEISEKLCISESYYSLIENGNRQQKLRADILIGLSEIFNLSVDQILELENQDKKESG